MPREFCLCDLIGDIAGLMLKMCVWVGRVRGVFLPILVGV